MKQTWLAMLQMVPNMSKDRASSLTGNFSASSSFTSLYDHLNNHSLPVADRMICLQNMFDSVSNNNNQLNDGRVTNKVSKRNGLECNGKATKHSKQVKLSKSLFHLMTCTDPDQIIGVGI